MSPFPVGREIASIWAGTTGKLDEVAVEDIRRYEKEFLDYIGHTSPSLFESLATSKKFDDDLSGQLEKLHEDFAKQFQATPDKSSK